MWFQAHGEEEAGGGWAVLGEGAASSCNRALASWPSACCHQAPVPYPWQLSASAEAARPCTTGSFGPCWLVHACLGPSWAGLLMPQDWPHNTHGGPTMSPQCADPCPCASPGERLGRADQLWKWLYGRTRQTGAAARGRRRNAGGSGNGSGSSDGDSSASSRSSSRNGSGDKTAEELAAAGFSPAFVARFRWGRGWAGGVTAERGWTGVGGIWLAGAQLCRNAGRRYEGRGTRGVVRARGTAKAARGNTARMLAHWAEQGSGGRVVLLLTAASVAMCGGAHAPPGPSNPAAASATGTLQARWHPPASLHLLAHEERRPGSVWTITRYKDILRGAKTALGRAFSGAKSEGCRAGPPLESNIRVTRKAHLWLLPQRHAQRASHPHPIHIPQLPAYSGRRPGSGGRGHR